MSRESETQTDEAEMEPLDLAAFEQSRRIRIMRRALHQRAKDLGRHLPKACLDILGKLKRRYEKLFRDSEQCFRPDNVRNYLRTTDILESMRDEFKTQSRMMREATRGLAPDKRSQLVEFWNGFAEVFLDLMELVHDLYQAVAEKAREGYAIELSVPRHILELIADTIVACFSQA